MKTLLTTQEVADHFGVHPRTIQKWLAAKKIAALRISRRCVRFDIVAVAAFEKAITQPAKRK
jgi:excisionase family DNA binding protein